MKKCRWLTEKTDCLGCSKGNDISCPKNSTWDCRIKSPVPRRKRIKAWALIVDNCGYYCGISYKGITILQLNPGTVRNKEYGIEFINMLNKNGLKIAIKI